ncbi:MAG: tetratricopeptide repeat protein [Planctomycetes bacterium]|nr:tetratricopeptide repeat protein [Planctomycetota bacterium]
MSRDDTFDDLIDEACQAIDTNDLLHAIRTLTTVIEALPQGVDALTLRGIVQLRLDNLHAAMGDLSRAIEASPDAPLAFYWRGLVHFRLGRPREACEDLTAVLQKGLQIGPVFWARALTLMEMRDWHGALDDLIAAQTHDPNRKEVGEMIAVVRQNMAGSRADVPESITKEDEMGKNWWGPFPGSPGSPAEAMESESPVELRIDPNRWQEGRRVRIVIDAMVERSDGAEGRVEGAAS